MRDAHCPRCNMAGWLRTGRAYPMTSESVIYDVALYEYIRCPLRCDHGVYVLAKDIGARPLDTQAN